VNRCTSKAAIDYCYWIVGFKF